MKWYKIENKADRAEIWIYQQIGEDFFSSDGITAKSFQEELSGIKATQIDLHINCPGGTVWDGITIHNLLKQHPAKVTTYIDGLAASIASVIALAGDHIIMAHNGLFMIHEAMGMTAGFADEIRQFADKLEKVSGLIATTYITKTKKDEKEIKKMMSAETWMTAPEALEMGFIDEISGEADMAACSTFVPVMAKAGFQHIPENISGKKEIPKARELERILRDGGCSEQMAKSIIAGGYKGDQREVAPLAEQREVAAPIPKKKDRVSDLLAEGVRFI